MTKRCVLIALLLLLSGCLGASFTVDYNEQMQPISCHAVYMSLGRDVEGASFAVCGGTANVRKSKVNVEALRAATSAFGAALEAALAGGL
jgi:hypothetical protein